MENNLKVFTNEQFGKVRVVEIDGEGWLVGKDVVEALGYALSKSHTYSEYLNKYCANDCKHYIVKKIK